MTETNLRRLPSGTAIDVPRIIYICGGDDPAVAERTIVYAGGDDCFATYSEEDIAAIDVFVASLPPLVSLPAEKPSRFDLPCFGVCKVGDDVEVCDLVNGGGRWDSGRVTRVDVDNKGRRHRIVTTGGNGTSAGWGTSDNDIRWPSKAEKPTRTEAEWEAMEKRAKDAETKATRCVDGSAFSYAAAIHGHFRAEVGDGTWSEMQTKALAAIERLKSHKLEAETQIKRAERLSAELVKVSKSVGVTPPFLIEQWGDAILEAIAAKDARIKALESRAMSDADRKIVEAARSRHHSIWRNLAGTLASFVAQPMGTIADALESEGR